MVAAKVHSPDGHHGRHQGPRRKGSAKAEAKQKAGKEKGGHKRKGEGTQASAKDTASPHRIEGISRARARYISALTSEKRCKRYLRSYLQYLCRYISDPTCKIYVCAQRVRA
jgi:hypothetical protein